MNTKLTSFAHASISIALGLALIPATAQTPRAQSEKELSRKAPVDGVQACSLITRADVSKATGRDPYVDPEPAGQGGLQEGQGTADANLRRRGARLFPLPKPDNEYQGNVAFSSRNPATICSHYRSTRLRAARRIRCVQRSNH